MRNQWFLHLRNVRVLEKNFLNWDGVGGEAGGEENRVFRMFLNLFSLLCFVLRTEDFTPSMTALIAQCLLSLTA